MEQAIQSVQSFFKRKDVVISAHRYGIDAMGAMRSEERRVGKECRSRWSPYH